MTDIFPIKSLVNPYPIALIPTIFAIILWVLIFFLINKNKKQIKNTKQETIKPTLKKIKLNCEQILNSDNFYKEIEKVLRDYLQIQWIKKSHSLSFKEIEQLKIDETLKDILKSVYFKQYKLRIEDNQQNKKKICELAKNLIKDFNSSTLNNDFHW